jgi:KamA family protein
MSSLNMLPRSGTGEAPRFRPLLRRHIDQIPQLRNLPHDDKLALKAVSAVLPFRVNPYVIDNLIDWSRVPDDPIYQLTFPQRGMLDPADFDRMADLVRREAPAAEIQAAARGIQMSLNPHPAGQMELNVPHIDGEPLSGMQHKYRETVLYFPSQGQTCHAYCTYCFRWAQFVGIEELRFSANEADLLARYVRRRREVTDVLFTGGDPMVMNVDKLRRYIDPLLEIDHLIHIRIGTKALAYWPYRFTTDRDADDFLRLVERVHQAGKHLAIMAHVSHAAELYPEPAQEAIRRLRDAGCIIRSQAPLIRHVNDNSRAWAEMWRLQLDLGIVPYYMFVERDTGAKNYFEVPLARAYDIYRRAIRRVPGTGRTARGPSMSATPGKVVVEGVTEVAGEKVFVLKLLQGRNPKWVQRPFFARFDPEATWLDDLRPAFGEERFFFAEEMDELGRNPEEKLWQVPEPI